MTNLPPSLPDERRHDLDALRGFAMLLGVVLHASIAYLGQNPWPVNDRSQSFVLGFVWAFIHGWRMELFFLIAGFFTAMVLRRDGPGGMLKRRGRRLAIPFLLGLAVVQPLNFWLDGTVRAARELQGTPASQFNEPIHEAVRRNDLDALKKTPPDDPELGNAQYLAAALGRQDALRVLLQRNDRRPAATMLAALHEETALHAAARFGQPASVRVILEGAQGRAWEREVLEAKNDSGQTARELANGDGRSSRKIARLLGLTVAMDDAVARAEVCDLLGDQPTMPGRLRLLSLARQPLLGHLWFMWVLLILTLAFAAWAWVDRRWALPAVPRWMLAEWTRLLWLMPVTTLLFWWATADVGFGITGDMAFAEKPAAILTYGLFFAFGAALRLRGCEPARVPWLAWIQLPLLVAFVLPLAFALGTWGAPTAHFLSAFLQAAFAWGMTFTLLDLFARHLAKPIAALRYLADASLWVYILHLPIVIALQWWMADWKLWPIVKCGLVIAITLAVLLLANHFLVRRTWLGWVLNGKRETEGGGRN